jgi:TolA-binding protein
VALANAFRLHDFYDYALEVLEKGKVKFDPPLNIEIADIYQAKGDYNNMISCYLDLIHNQNQYIDLVKGRFQIILSDYGADKISISLKEELLKRTEKYPNNTIYAELLYWYSVQKKEYVLALIQAKALDRQFGEQGERVFQLANILFDNQQYEKAAEGYEYVMKLGNKNRFYQAAEINLLHTKFKSITSGSTIKSEELIVLVKDYETVLNKYGENANTVELMRNLAQIQAFWVHDFNKAETLLDKVLKMDGLPREVVGAVKLELGDVLLFEGKKWSASLLYKQVEKDFKNDPIGFEAKFKAAKFFYYVGEMEWSKVQLDVLKGATSKLISNDAMELSLVIEENIDDDSTYTTLSYFARADLLAWQQNYNDAFLLFDTIEAIFPNHNILPNISFRRAEIYQSLNNIDTAIYFFNKVVANFPNASIADNALFKMAKIYDYIKVDKPKAIECYEKILLEYPGSLFTVEARRRFNELKGKVL